jgi:hypothetical protein
LNVDYHQRNLSDDGQSDILAVETDSRSTGGGERPGSGQRGSDAHADRGNFIFSLDGNATPGREFGHHHLQDGRGGGDRIPGEKVTSCGERAAHDRR